MNYQLFILCQILLILLTAAVLWGWRRLVGVGYERLGVPKGKRSELLNYSLAGLILWLVILGQLAWLGFFSRAESLFPRLVVVFLLPVSIGVLLLALKGFRTFLRLLPLRWLILGQIFRVPLELIQWLGYEGGFVPPQLTFVGFNFDIMVGLSAWVAASAFFRRGRVRRIEALIWNLFGIFLILQLQVALFFSVPSPYRVWDAGIDYWAIGAVPFIWIPGFLAPVGVLLHLYAIVLLWQIPSQRRRFSLQRRKGSSGEG